MIRTLPHTELNEANNRKALEVYNAHYDNDLYKAATEGKTIRYCNELIDAALFRCGSPYFYSKFHFSRKARAFLSVFPADYRTLETINFYLV